MLMEGFELAQIVGVLLHHLPALRQILGAVIRIPDAVPLLMGKLAFYPVPVITKLVEKGGRHSAKTVDAHHILSVSHEAERVQHG